MRPLAPKLESHAGLQLGVNAPEGRIEYTRDARGRIERIRTSTGIDTRYEFNDFGQIVKVIDRGLSSTGAEAEIAMAYDDLGRKTEIMRPNGTRTTYGYDEATGWLAEIRHLRGGAENQLTLTYHRDSSGVIDWIREVAGDGASATTTQWDYTYDELKRLETATQRNVATNGVLRSYAYAYDRNGNRVSESINGVSAVTSTYNALDQLVSSSDGRTYNWDAKSRLASETGGPIPARSYTWDVDDRLLSVTIPAGTVTYTYDHLGTRTSRNAPSEDDPVRRYLVDYQNPTGYSQVLAEVNSDATTTRANYWYTDGFGPAAQSTHDPTSGAFSTAFLLGDHLSTTRGLTDSAGAASLLSYAPFGDLIAGDSSLTPHQFTGQWRDRATGMQYHRARWLDTRVGRWGSVDPVFDFFGAFGSSLAYGSVQLLDGCDVAGREFNLNSLQQAASIIARLAVSAFRFTYGLILRLLNSKLVAIFTSKAFARFIIATLSLLFIGFFLTQYWGYQNIKQMEAQILGEWRPLYEQAGRRWNIPPEVVAAIHLNEVRDYDNTFFLRRWYAPGADRILFIDRMFGSDILPSQLYVGFVEPLVEERRSGPDPEHRFIGTAYEPQGMPLPSFTSSRRTLRDIEWNIDLSAQWLRKICSRDRIAERPEDRLNKPPAGMEFLRMEAGAWDLANPFFMIELQSAYQSQGSWLGGATFGDADGAFRDVQQAWK